MGAGGKDCRGRAVAESGMLLSRTRLNRTLLGDLLLEVSVLDRILLKSLVQSLGPDDTSVSVHADLGDTSHGAGRHNMRHLSDGERHVEGGAKALPCIDPLDHIGAGGKALAI